MTPVKEGETMTSGQKPNTFQETPRLDKPGAGLPFYEWAIANYIIFPMRFRRITPQLAIEQFESEVSQILTLTENLDSNKLSARRLIPRLRGLEDSSRYWSTAMTLRHIVIVLKGSAGILTALSHNKTDMQERGTADVKPEEELDLETIRDEFKDQAEQFSRLAKKLEIDKYPEAKFRHPWFGKLNARQWLLFVAPHTEIHRKQIEEILKRL